MDQAPSVDELAGDPHPHLARLRQLAPVAHVPGLGGWLVTGREAALAVLHDSATYTVDDPRFSTARVVGRSMLSTDGEEHARHRQPFVAPFRRRRVEERFGATITRRVAGLLDAAADAANAAGAEIELRSGLAGPLAAAVMADALGLDGDRPDVVARLLAWYRDIVDSVSGVAAGRTVTAAGDAAMEALRQELAPVATDDTAADAAVVLFGGIETTEAMILNAAWWALVTPGAWAALVADRTLIPAAVEESLRLEPAAAVVDRYATRDVELAGASIRTGDLVAVSLAGANRDPAAFADPDRYDLRRPNLRRQLSFAAGPHVCLGMDLARLEAATALDALVTRWRGLHLAPDAPTPTGLVFRKPERLPVCP
jgi:cytochrome P450